MRIWSLHPSYLDTKGVVALWRETLLAKKVLAGQTKGYRNHPQLKRFKESSNPVSYVDYYLSVVHIDSVERGYKFDREKFESFDIEENFIAVTSGQVIYEWEHLLRKLKARDLERYEAYKDYTLDDIKIHPIFKVLPGDIEPWEIVQ